MNWVSPYGCLLPLQVQSRPLSHPSPLTNDGESEDIRDTQVPNVPPLQPTHLHEVLFHVGGEIPQDAQLRLQSTGYRPHREGEVLRAGGVVVHDPERMWKAEEESGVIAPPLWI